MTTLATGFALVVQPVAATTIATDPSALTVGEVRIPVGDGMTIPAYRAMPEIDGPTEEKRPLPVVLVVQEIFGVHEHIKDICRRLARLGYLAVAPELYARQGDVSTMTKIDDVLAVVRRVPDEQVLSDLDATAAWAGSVGGDPSRTGIVGFCWGGRIVWLYSAHNSRIRAAAAWYGRLVGDASELQPKHPIDIASELKVPVLGLYGGADPGIPVETVERMRQALSAAGNPSEIVVYPDTPHAFFADYRPSYRKEQAEDGWKRMLAWFSDHGLV